MPVVNGKVDMAGYGEGAARNKKLREKMAKAKMRKKNGGGSKETLISQASKKGSAQERRY